MREMKQSGIPWLWNIPKVWQIKRAKYVFSFVKEVVGDKNENYERLSLTMKGVLKRDKESSDGLQPNNFAGYQILRANQLVFKLIDLENTATSRVGLSQYEGLVSPAYIVLKNQQTDNRFHYYQMISLYYRSIYNSIGGDNVRSALNAKDLLEMKIILPPLSEQTAIANYLDEKCGKIDTLIENEEKVIAELKEYKKSIIQKATTKGISKCELKDSRIGYFGDIPKNWEVIRNKNLFTIKKEIVGKKFTDYQLLSLTQQGVVKKDINSTDGNLPESFETYQRVPRDTIVIALFDISTRSTTISGWSKYEGMISSAYRVLVPNEKVNLAYYDYLFTHIGADRCYVSEGKNIRCSIDEATFGSIKIICPPLPEQKAIAEYLDRKTADIDKLITIKKQKIDELKEYKKSLIYECVTGKKEVM